MESNPLTPVFFGGSMRRYFSLQNAALLTFVSIGFILPAAVSAGGLKSQERIDIIRGLTAEYATTKISLPKGRKGVTLDSDGKIDQTSLKHEMTQYGTAAQANSLVQITAVDIQDKAILFEINGGGKSKTKWYDHIQAGMGTLPDTTPTGTPAPATGSYVLLRFPNKLENMSVAELKNYLAPVLDFSPRTPLQAVSRPVPPKFQAAIQAKKAAVGMDRDMVIAAMGSPQRKVRETKDGVEQEDWIYGAPPMKVTFVTFENDEVVNVQEYEGGIRGELETAPETDPRINP